MSFHVAAGLKAITARPPASSGLLAAVFVVVSALASALAVAQERQPPKDEPSVLESVGRWFEEQGNNISSTFKDAGKKVESFGHEAGVAAKTTVESAKDAAGAVRLPTGVVDGHEKCRNAPNGAPDCIAAATAMCKTKGFESGKSADMTTAEVCPAQVYLSGRNSGPGCRTETFVSRALCQ